MRNLYTITVEDDTLYTSAFASKDEIDKKIEKNYHQIGKSNTQ